jgi:hypothetical protein
MKSLQGNSYPSRARGGVFHCAITAHFPRASWGRIHMRNNGTIESDLLIGAPAIAKFFGQPVEWVYYQHRVGNIKLDKLGKKFIARKSTLMQTVGVGSFTDCTDRRRPPKERM